MSLCPFECEEMKALKAVTQQSFTHPNLSHSHTHHISTTAHSLYGNTQKGHLFHRLHFVDGRLKPCNITS
jgi:hypothetical protein